MKEAVPTDSARLPRVAIIGGGVAGLFSALALSDPALQDPAGGPLCEITVYSRGWRLGGKCASGRNPAHHHRVEEHGLHLWFGFYRNALGWTRHLLDQLPAELGHHHRSFEDSFIGLDDVVLFEEWPSHEQATAISALRLCFPADEAPAPAPSVPATAPSVPGSPSAPAPPLEVPDFGTTVRRVAQVLALSGAAMFTGAASFGPSRLFARLVAGGVRLGVRLVPRHLGSVPGARPGRLDRARLGLLLGLLRVTRMVALILLRPESHVGEGRRRQIFTGLDLLTAALSGIVEDRLLEVGFGTIDDLELREWLRRHGARPASIGSGSVLWALYDLVFAYDRGNTTEGELAAGRGLLALLRLLGGYQDHFGYRMASSMGEVVIAPLFDLLRSRGVHFAFFRDLRAIHLDDHGGLASIELHRQADVDVDAWDPFAWTGSPAKRHWSIEPDWAAIGLDPAVVGADALENGMTPTPGEGRQVLRLGSDVDQVILAVPAPVLADPGLRQELSKVPAWRDMFDHSASVATVAFQVWSDAQPSLPEALNERFGSAIVSSYDQPFSTYCQMDQLAAVEQWTGPNPMRIAYGCGVWHDDGFDRLDVRRADRGAAPTAAGLRGEQLQRLELVQRLAAASLQRLSILPDPPSGGGRVLRRRRLPVPPPADPSSAGPALAPFLVRTQAPGPGGDASNRSSEGDAAGGEQHNLWVRLNDAAAQRYVTTPPTNPWFRIDPANTAIAGLYAAGDWTSSLIDGGCVEATVISALLAVRGLARQLGVAEDVLQANLAVIGENTWLYHGGRGGPPPLPTPPTAPGPAGQESPNRVGALTAVPGPYASDRTVLYTWLAKVDPQRAAAVARRCFADMTGGEVQVEPIGSLAMLTAGDIAAVSSEAPVYRDLGRLSEKQVVVWLPCRVRWGSGSQAIAAPAGGVKPPPSFALFVPYVWVDNPMSLTTGREGLGWPKAMARFEPAIGLSLPLSLSVYGLAQFAPDSVVGSDLDLLRISPAAEDGLQADLEHALAGTEVALRLTAAAAEAFGADAIDALTSLFSALRHQRLPQLFAKSLIAATDNANDDFLQVVTAEATVLAWHDVSLLGPCQLVVHDVASHPVARDLGLVSQDLPFGLRVELDFRQESGVVRWSSWESPSQRRSRANRLRPRGRRRATCPDP